ncbi:MAG: hypothetical protein ACXWPS_21085 [Ktedonobacteraceae bacterium]
MTSFGATSIPSTRCMPSTIVSARRFVLPYFDSYTTRIFDKLVASSKKEERVIAISSLRLFSHWIVMDVVSIQPTDYTYQSTSIRPRFSPFYRPSIEASW